MLSSSFAVTSAIHANLLAFGPDYSYTNTVKLLCCRASSAGLMPWVLALCLGAVAGCGRNDIQIYRVAKAQEATPSASLPQGHPDVGSAAGSSSLTYKVPSGWQEAPPGEMRAASFRVAGQNGKQADVSVIPLPGMAGSDLDNVNRWRGQVGLKGVSSDELAKLAEPVEVDHQPAQLYDQAGENPGSGDKTRILAAIARRDGTTWFFKMTGDDALVGAQKPAFVEFLKSVTLPSGMGMAGLPPSHPPIGGGAELPPSHPPIGGAAMEAQGGAGTSSGQDKPAWQVPSGWQETSGGQFLVAKFLVKGTGDAQAAVNVSMSGGDGGGLLANVNRWRGQLGLAPIAQDDLSKEVQPLDVPGSSATLTQMTGTDPRTGHKTRLIAVIVPQGQQTWFYKLMGNEQLVGEQKDAFTRFVQTAKYP